MATKQQNNGIDFQEQNMIWEKFRQLTVQKILAFYKLVEKLYSRKFLTQQTNNNVLY